MRRLLRAALSTAAFLAAAGLARGAAPDPLEILRSSLSPFGRAYRGRMISVVKNGRHTHLADARVCIRPPNLYRKEFFRPGEKLEKLVTSDGETEWIYFPDKKTVWKGDAAKTQSKRMAPDEEWRLLTRNYAVELAGSEKVAGRDAWVVRVSPREPGKPRRTLWIDKQESVVLESKEFHPDGTLATQSHFINIEFPKDLPDGAFSFAPPAGAAVKEHGLEPDFMSLEELRRSGTRAPRLPEELPEGFALESGNFFDVGGKEVTHLRFTDGMVVLSLFESSRPVTAGGTLHWTPTDLEEGSIGFSQAGKVVRWRAGRSYFSLVGNLSTDALRRMARSIK